MAYGEQGQIISRRQFLRGDFSSRRPVLRPPWVVAEAEFLSHCNGCGNCREACMQHIIVLADGGYPQIDFLNGECTLCGDCARACTEGAFAYSPFVAPWQVKAVVMPECLTRRGVVCRSCGEQEKIARTYEQQPPLIPHKIDGYRIDIKENRCLKCHDRPFYKKEEAPKIGDSHYRDREGKELKHISMGRYECTQCHVPQADAKPLVENTFQSVPVKAAKGKQR